MYKTLLLSACLLLTSCSSVLYVSDRMQEYDPLAYQTYTTQDYCDREISPIMAQRIKNAIEINLRNQGYQVSDRPDVMVKYYVKNTTKKYVEECIEEYDRWVGGETCRSLVVTYEEGSIIIDVIDLNKNSVIWHGAVRGPSFNALKEPEQKINKMVGKLMEMYFANSAKAEPS